MRVLQKTALADLSLVVLMLVSMFGLLIWIVSVYSL